MPATAAELAQLQDDDNLVISGLFLGIFHSSTLQLKLCVIPLSRSIYACQLCAKATHLAWFACGSLVYALISHCMHLSSCHLLADLESAGK